MSELHPGIRKETMVAFEVPEDSVGDLTLRVPKKGLFGGDDRKVRLEFKR